MQSLLDYHLRCHPELAPLDAVKLIFQAYLGCGHLLADEAAVTDRICAEEAALIPCADEPLTEDLGPGYVRLNLRPAMAVGLEPVWIARLMALSCENMPAHTRADVAACLHALDLRSLDAAAVHALAKRLVDEPTWLPSHSEGYRAAYAPAYRVIGKVWASLLPALCAIAAQNSQPRLLVTLDGPCCSGKTTMAAQLARVLDAAVAHTDDFYIPHAQKTAERLALPGGNADVERLCAEFLDPWMLRGEGVYKPYSCKQDRLMEPISMPKRRILILEGSYCNLPAIRKHAGVRLFLQVDKDEQRRRLLRREGQAAMPMFENRWIPLEEAYFAAYSLPDSGCTVLTSPSSAVD